MIKQFSEATQYFLNYENIERLSIKKKPTYLNKESQKKKYSKYRINIIYTIS